MEEIFFRGPKFLNLKHIGTWHNRLNVLSMSSMFWVVNRMLELVDFSLKELNWCEFGLIWFRIDLRSSKTWNQILQVFVISQSFISKTDNISLQLLQTPSELHNLGHTNVEISVIFSLQQYIVFIPTFNDGILLIAFEFFMFSLLAMLAFSSKSSITSARKSPLSKCLRLGRPHSKSA